MCCGRELEHDGDVAELEVGVDEARPASRDRWARATARLVAITDLPAPPLVENTVMTSSGFTVEFGEAAAVVRRRRRRCRRGEVERDPLDALDELGGVGRGREHVADTRAQRLLEHGGRQLVGHQERPHLGVRPKDRGDRCQGLIPGLGRAQDDHDGDAGQAALELLDRTEGRGALAQLSAQPVPVARVHVDDRNGNSRCGLVSASGVGETHFLSPSVNPSGP